MGCAEAGRREGKERGEGGNWRRGVGRGGPEQSLREGELGSTPVGYPQPEGVGRLEVQEKEREMEESKGRLVSWERKGRGLRKRKNGRRLCLATGQFGSLTQ